MPRPHSHRPPCEWVLVAVESGLFACTEQVSPQMWRGYHKVLGEWKWIRVSMRAWIQTLSSL